MLQISSAIVGFSSELVRISSELVQISSELVSTIAERLIISVFKKNHNRVPTLTNPAPKHRQRRSICLLPLLNYLSKQILRFVQKSHCTKVAAQTQWSLTKQVPANGLLGFVGRHVLM